MKTLPDWMLNLFHEKKIGLDAEAFKYTDLALLADEKLQWNQAANIANFSFEHGFGDICSLASAKQKHADLLATCVRKKIDAQKYPFAAMNVAQQHDARFIFVPDQTEMTLALHFANAENLLSQPQHCIVLGKYSCLTLLEDFRQLHEESCMMNIVNHIFLAEGATLNYYKIQQENAAAIHVATTFIQQKENSHVNYVNIASGGKFSRDDVVVDLQGAHASCHTAGLYFLKRDLQYIDHHVAINHIAPHTQSDMLYKGLIDKKSRAVFNGRLHVAPHAQKISAHQANHHLLLHQAAEAYAKPELEIYADDVKCKHGATTGQLDEQALFYLRARGIDRTSATQMLMESFANEIFSRIHVPEIKNNMMTRFF